MLARQRRKDQLRRELEELENQDVFGQPIKREHQAPESVAERRSSSMMPPPPLPENFLNGKVSSSIPTPLATPPISASTFDTDRKHGRSRRSSRDIDAPPQKLARYTQPFDHYDAEMQRPPASQNRRPRPRSPSPRAIPLEDRIGRNIISPGRRNSNDHYAPSSSYYDPPQDDRQGYRSLYESYQPQAPTRAYQAARGGYHVGNKQWKRDNMRGGKNRH